MIAAGTPVSSSPRSSVQLLDRGAVLVEAAGRVLDELAIGKPGVDDLARDGVRQRDVGADIEPGPDVGPLRGRGPPRVDGDEPRRRGGCP